MESEFEVSNKELYEFYSNHGELNHYLIQIKNCLNNECIYCERDHYESNINILFPPPIFVELQGNELQSKDRDKIMEKESFFGFTYSDDIAIFRFEKCCIIIWSLRKQIGIK